MSWAGQGQGRIGQPDLWGGLCVVAPDEEESEGDGAK